MYDVKIIDGTKGRYFFSSFNPVIVYRSKDKVTCTLSYNEFIRFHVESSMTVHETLNIAMCPRCSHDYAIVGLADLLTEYVFRTKGDTHAEDMLAVLKRMGWCDKPDQE